MPHKPYGWKTVGGSSPSQGPLPFSALLLDPGILSATAIVAFSSRKLRTAYSGPAMGVALTNGGSTTNIGFTGSNDLDIASLHSLVGSGTGFLSTFNDQVGSANATHLANDPIVINAGVDQTLNSRIAADYSQSTSTGLLINLTTTYPQPYTLCFCYKINSLGSGGQGLMDGPNGASGRVNLQLDTPTNNRYIASAGGNIATPNGTVNTTSVHSVYVVNNDAVASHIWLDGSNQETSNVNGTRSWSTDGSTGPMLGGSSLFTAPLGQIAEFIAFNGALSSTDEATIRTSWQAYFGAI